jgi:hypothetical protein
MTVDHAARLTRRRWFQFGLGMICIVLALLSIFFAVELHTVRQRQALRAVLEQRGAEFGPRWESSVVPAPSFVRRLLGDELAPMITLPSDCWTPSNESQGLSIDEIERVFPEAQLMQNL